MSESLAAGKKLSSTLIAIITMLSFLGALSLVLGAIVLLRTRRRRLATIRRMPDPESALRDRRSSDFQYPYQDRQQQQQQQTQMSQATTATRASEHIGFGSSSSDARTTYLGSRFSVTTVASDDDYRRSWQAQQGQTTRQVSTATGGTARYVASLFSSRRPSSVGPMPNPYDSSSSGDDPGGHSRNASDGRTSERAGSPGG